jgi:hypothetical protein
MDHTDDEPALGVLREIWSANARTGEEVEDELRGSRPKVCRNMKNIGFGGMAPDAVPSETDGTNTPVDTDVRRAWRARLEREGKLRPGAVSVREMLDGPDRS